MNPAHIERTQPVSTSNRGNWMQTYTGGRFYPLDPTPAEVLPGDIAHALSLICRYGGHVQRFYSVAEHCVLLSHAVSPENALWALLHDAAEAYVGDMVRPLKRHMPEFQHVEARILLAIARRFNLWPEIPAEVHEADNRIILTERAALMRKTDDVWTEDGLTPLPVRIEGWPPAVAESCWLGRLWELSEGVTA